ncbi:MAG TPA: PH domain-containing protein [Microbacteriaceae bacterium]|nr:PH domain-containing protein [Microbacteriaceae bacterium]
MSAAQPIETERRIVALRPSARRLLAPAILFVLLAGAVPWLTGVLTEAWHAWIVVVCAAAALVLGCVIPLLAWLARRTTVSSRAIVTQHGLITRVRDEVLHARGYTVSVEQSIGQRLFHSGDVVLRLPGEAESLRLVDVPRPELLQALLGDLVAAAPASPGLAAGVTGDVTTRMDTNLLAELGDSDRTRQV